MQSMAMMDEMSSLPASSINVNGKLRLVQQTLLVANSNNVRYDTPVVNYTLSTSGPSTAALTWPEIIHSYLDRECMIADFVYYSITLIAEKSNSTDQV